MVSFSLVSGSYRTRNHTRVALFGAFLSGLFVLSACAEGEFTEPLVRQDAENALVFLTEAAESFELSLAVVNREAAQARAFEAAASLEEAKIKLLLAAGDVAAAAKAQAELEKATALAEQRWAEAANAARKAADAAAAAEAARKKAAEQLGKLNQSNAELEQELAELQRQIEALEAELNKWRMELGA